MLRLTNEALCKYWTSLVSQTYVPTLPSWEESSRPPAPSRNLPFWDDSGLNVRYLRIFQVDHTFYKLDVKVLAAINDIRCALLLSTIFIVSLDPLMF